MKTGEIHYQRNEENTCKSKKQQKRRSRKYTDITSLIHIKSEGGTYRLARMQLSRKIKTNFIENYYNNRSLHKISIE